MLLDPSSTNVTTESTRYTNKRWSIIRCRRGVVVALLIGLSLIPTLCPPVKAFKIIDQTTCKEIDRNTRTCKQRTSDFLIDDWAYLWFMGTFESSDVGAKLEGRVFDPSGNPFNSLPLPSAFSGSYESRVLKAGEMVGWIGINVTANAMEVSVYSQAISASFSDKVVDKIPSVTRTEGEWRVELTLDGKAVVSEHIGIGIKMPQTIMPVPSTTTSSEITIYAVTGLVIVIGASLFVLFRHRKMTNRSPT